MPGSYLRPKLFQVSPETSLFQPGQTFTKSLSLTPRHAGAIRGNQTQTMFHVQVGPPRLISFTVKKKKKV